MIEKIELTQKKSGIIKNDNFERIARAPLQKKYVAKSEDMTEVFVIHDRCFVIMYGFFIFIRNTLYIAIRYYYFSLYSLYDKNDKNKYKELYIWI